MKILAQYSAILEEALQHTKFPKEPHNLYDPLRYFLQLGGKRMRPMLTLMACKLVGNPLEKALPAALAVEYFHNFSSISLVKIFEPITIIVTNFVCILWLIF